jgi:hypothetical protein
VLALGGWRGPNFLTAQQQQQQQEKKKKKTA